MFGSPLKIDVKGRLKDGESFRKFAPEKGKNFGKESRKIYSKFGQISRT